MKQTRVRTGQEFEDSISDVEWVKNPTKPLFIWTGEGKNVYERIKSVGYDVHKFYLKESSTFKKWDLISKKDSTKTADAKRYIKKKLSRWTLYSEPYFKVATRSNLNKIGLEEYNKFVDEFYELNSKNGTFDTIIKKMTENSVGIVTLDGFIPIERIEFRTTVIKSAWKGYHRITIQFRVKD
jgi:hypothetical protein